MKNNTSFLFKILYLVMSLLLCRFIIIGEYGKLIVFGILFSFGALVSMALSLNEICFKLGDKDEESN